MKITKEKLAELEAKAGWWDRVEETTAALKKENRHLRILIAGLEAFRKAIWDETLKDAD